MHIILVLCSLIALNANAQKYKVGLVFDKAGKDDKSFNAAAYRGATDAARQLETFGSLEKSDKPTQSKNSSIVLEFKVAKDKQEIEPVFKEFAEKEFDLIIGLGEQMKAAVEKAAKFFPKSKFLLIDAVVKAPNVRSVTFKEHEGAFLVGAIAALTSKSKVIGFIGGMNVPPIKRFEKGYTAGAKHVVPGITVLTDFIGNSSDAWNNPPKANAIALEQNSKKADVILAAAGASGMGVFDAIESKKIYGIGVDTNQNWIKPGKILTSMVKKVDRVVFEALKDLVTEEFKTGEFSLGLKEEMVDFAVNQYNELVLQSEVQNTANNLKQQIVDKKIIVPN